VRLALHNIRSVFNVGSVFRTADAMGVEKIYLTGYTPDPARKTALGAEIYVPWEKVKNIHALIKRVRAEGATVVALEQAKNSISLKKFSTKKRKNIVLIVGNEVRGLSPAILKKSDYIVEIPMREAMVRQAHHPRYSGRGKESLNVAVAAGIAMYTLA
jgi:23S rRNA (guanosine2251-2'-O)-methyltransferase